MDKFKRLQQWSILLAVLILSLVFAGCNQSTSPSSEQQAVDTESSNVSTVVASSATTTSTTRNPNILLMIGDDMGNESLSCFEIGKNTADTPTLDQLCKDGIRFDNFWSQPICTPTRATLMTGRYGFRTGVGRPTGDKEAKGYFPEPPAKPESAPYEPPRPNFNRRPNAPTDYGILSSEVTLPNIIKENNKAGYKTAAIGKWHIADTRNGWEKHPGIVGFDHFSGLIRGFPDSFFTWNKVVNGEWSGATGYTPNDKASDAIAWIEQQQDNPWFMWFAFNLPHTPLHLPPADVLNTDYSSIDPKADPLEDPLPYFRAMLESMDTQIAKVLNSLTEEQRDNTYVIFMGDNGSTRNTVTEPFRAGAAKGSIYQGGVNVPLIVSGPGVKHGVSKALVNSTDLFSTILELTGVDAASSVPENVTIDSTSIVPYFQDPNAVSIREFVYADVFAGNFAGIEDANFAMRNQRYKLLRHQGSYEFYDLQNDPYETENLLERDLTEVEQQQHDLLSEELKRLRASS